MPFLMCHVALLLSLVGTAAAARLVEQDLMRFVASNVGNLSDLMRGTATNAGNLSKFTMPNPGDLVDFEEYLSQSDIAKKVSRHKIKCCCDKYGTRLSHKIKAAWNYDVKERSERCTFGYAKGDHVKCKTLPKPDWAALPLASAANAEQHCKIHRDDVKQVYETLGSPAKYCSAAKLPVKMGRLEPEFVKLGGKFEVKCDTDVGASGVNYESTTKEVACVYDTAEAGKLDEQPECKKVAHCAESGYGNGDPRAAPAGLGEEGKVRCLVRGWRPVEGVIPICQENGEFSPGPACEPQPEWCKAKMISAPGKPYLPAAVVDYQVKAECAPGWESTSHVTCQEDGEFEPLPQCSKIQSYCQIKTDSDMEGQPQFMAAEVNEPVTVWCTQNGYEKTEPGKKALCGNDGQPFFDADQPLCKKMSAFCVFDDMRAEGRLTLSSTEAELGQTVQITCNAAGWEPAVVESTCQGELWGEFDPKPACKKKEGFCSAAVPNGLGSPSAPEAKVGEKVDVECGDSNFKPVEPKTTCGPDGLLSPEPKCEEIAAKTAEAFPLCPSSIWSFCAKEDLLDGGLACVASADAEVKDGSEVQCVPKKNNQDGNYECPAHLSVKCEPVE